MESETTKKKMEDEILEKTGPDKKTNERVFNFKVLTEETREVEIKGVLFQAKFYKTSSKTQGIRIPLEDNGLLFSKFYEYCETIEGERNDKEETAKIIAFITIARLDKGLEFYPIMGFYVYPWKKEGEVAHLVFNGEAGHPPPIERLELFVEYYKKKLKIKTRPTKSSFHSLSKLLLTDL